MDNQENFHRMRQLEAELTATERAYILAKRKQDRAGAAAARRAMTRATNALRELRGADAC